MWNISSQGQAICTCFVHRDIADSIDMSDWSTLKGHHFVSVPETDFALSGQIKTICANRGIVPDIIITTAGPIRCCWR